MSEDHDLQEFFLNKLKKFGALWKTSRSCDSGWLLCDLFPTIKQHKVCTLSLLCIYHQPLCIFKLNERFRQSLLWQALRAVLQTIEFICFRNSIPVLFQYGFSWLMRIEPLWNLPDHSHNPFYKTLVFLSLDEALMPSHSLYSSYDSMFLAFLGFVKCYSLKIFISAQKFN